MEMKLAPLPDNRPNIRFTQIEAKTYEAVTNEELPQWQRDFSYYAWYTRTPLTVWNDQYLKLHKATALKLVHGENVRLEPETIALVQQLIRVMQQLLTSGALPCSDRKAIPGIFTNAYNLLAWQDYYQAQQQVQQQVQATE